MYNDLVVLSKWGHHFEEELSQEDSNERRQLLQQCIWQSQQIDQYMQEGFFEGYSEEGQRKTKL